MEDAVTLLPERTKSSSVVIIKRTVSLLLTVPESVAVRVISSADPSVSADGVPAETLEIAIPASLDFSAYLIIPEVSLSVVRPEIALTPELSLTSA